MIDRKIIMIGGTAGVGKTTIGRKICCKLEIDHRLGTGFIREIINTTFDNKKNFLNKYTFRGKNYFDNYLKQCNYLHPFIMATKKRAEKEGTSLLIEGNHILPKQYANENNLFILLAPKNKNIHLRMLNAETHAKRQVYIEDIDNILNIEKYILESSKNTNAKIIKYTSIDKIIKQIICNLE